MVEVDVLPQRFAFNADFCLTVLEERRRRLLYNMLDTQSRFQILVETLHKHKKVVAVTYVARYCL